jgi:hypothetical protein
MKRFGLLFLLLSLAAALPSSAQMTCQPVVSGCHYNGCFIAYGGLAGVYNLSEAACALCNDAAEAAFFGYVRPDVGLCMSNADASRCVGCNWCTAVIYGCPERPEICHPVRDGDCDTSPITVSIDGPIKLSGEPTSFDINADGLPDRITWVTADTPLLAADRNGNGLIDDGSELFGTATPGSDGVNGYVALEKYDTDEDGWVTAAEAPNLFLWFDANVDGRTDPDELHSAWEHLRAIGTSYRDQHRIDKYGNQYAWAGEARLNNGHKTHTADVLFLRTN